MPHRFTAPCCIDNVEVNYIKVLWLSQRHCWQEVPGFSEKQNRSYLLKETSESSHAQMVCGFEVAFVKVASYTLHVFQRPR